jgi:hypothetical protein
MRQRASAAVENTLHIIQHRQNDLVLLADLMQGKPSGKITCEHFIQ